MSRENELAANRGAAGPAPAARAMSSGQITAEVLAALGPAKDARAGEILAAVIRHAHDLAREVRLTPRELLAAADFLRRCGEISDAARHEYVLLSDVLGLTMVVDTEIADVADGALETSVLGPFYRAGAPWEANGASISHGADDGEPARIHGQVLDTSGTPVSGAVLDVWSTNRHGRYENVDPSQPDYNLRGRFRSAAVLSEPTNGLGPVLDNLDEHVGYQTKLEREGVMFAAGPLSDDAEQQWHGDGLFIYRAESRDAAVRLAEADPMHASGARRFTVRPWLLNEGTFSVRLFYSGGKPRIE
jgi:uncharacterized protein YciI